MLLGCDTMVALPDTTRSGQTLFAKNSDRPPDECQPLVHRDRVYYSPSSVAECQFVELPQAEDYLPARRFPPLLVLGIRARLQ